jgi:Domain of unknown function (DUF2610)
MVKKFTTPCDFGGKTVPVTFYIGQPQPGSHPLGFQSKWLSTARGGSVPNGVMESFSKIEEIAEKNRVPFEDLCAYVIEEIKSSATLTSDAKSATELSKPDSDKK